MGSVMAELQRLRSEVAQNARGAQNANLNQNVHPQYITPPPTRPNLNLPEPPRFSGTPSELPSFQLKLCQFLRGNYNTYFDSQWGCGDAGRGAERGGEGEGTPGPINTRVVPG